MPIRFRGKEAAALHAGDFSQYSALSDEEKEQLCRSLLSEFGVTEVQVNRNGEMLHCCALPKHDEKHASAYLNYKKLTYYCFGCGQRGGLLWFIGTCRETTGTEARSWLAEQTGLGAEEQSLSALLQYFDAIYNVDDNRPPPMPNLSTSVLDPWMYLHPYMTEVRGIDEQVLMAFKVGYGVLPIWTGGDFRVQSHRIVIPHIWKGNLVGWQSRRIINDNTPKYQSSPDFPKDRTIYNYDEAADEVVVVESPMSVLSKAHRPWHIEATFGASVTERQCRLLAAHRKVILFMDNDEAGWLSTERLIEALEPYCIVYVVDSRWAADPADMDDATYDDLVANAIPASVWARPEALLPWAA